MYSNPGKGKRKKMVTIWGDGICSTVRLVTSLQWAPVSSDSSWHLRYNFVFVN